LPSTAGLDQFQPLQFNPVGANVGKLVVRLLLSQLSSLAPKTCDSLTAISGEIPRLPFTSSDRVSG